MNEVTLAILAALGGGFGVKVLDILLARVQFGQTTEADTRKTMRADIDRLTARVDCLQANLDEWKGKYYDLRTENVRLGAENEAMKGELADLKETNERLDAENRATKSEIAELKKTVARLSARGSQRSIT